MAIFDFDDSPAVSVDITVAGAPLQEYDHINEGGGDERTVTKYVEATSGQSFAVSIKLLPAFRFKGGCIVFEIYADGELMSKPMFINNQSDRSIIVKGRPAGHDKIEKFRFADVQTVEEASAAGRQDPRLKHLGSIVIKCAHKMAFEGTKHEYLNREDAPALREKDLKGRSVSHNVKLKAPQKCEPWTWYRTEPVLGQHNPAATFLFYYRSLAALKSLLVIPRTPSPTPPPALEDRDITTLSMNELRELQKRTQALRSQNEALVGIKRERKDDGDNRPRKAARSSRSYTQLEVDEKGVIRDHSVSMLPDREVIEIEDDD